MNCINSSDNTRNMSQESKEKIKNNKFGRMQVAIGVPEIYYIAFKIELFY